jgi:hypothetical protein
MLEGELESKFEQEMQEGEEEGILGTIGSVLGGLLSEGEGEMELHEFRVNGHRGLHEGEHQELHESGLHELEGKFELEGESGEQFFGKIFRGVGSLVRRAAPILRQVARVAAPMVATAIVVRSAAWSGRQRGRSWELAKPRWSCTSSAAGKRVRGAGAS